MLPTLWSEAPPQPLVRSVIDINRDMDLSQSMDTALARVRPTRMLRRRQWWLSEQLGEMQQCMIAHSEHQLGLASNLYLAQRLAIIAGAMHFSMCILIR